MFLGLAPAEQDVFARMPEIMPTAVEGERAQHDMGVLTGHVGHAHLRAVEAAQDRVQDVSGGEVVQVMVEQAFEFVRPPGAALRPFPLHFDPPAQIGRSRDGVHRQNAFDAYLVNEFTPFVLNRTSWPQMGATGCSFGGYHAVNFALRHPDIVTYAVSMSGAFDIPRRFLDGYYDQNAYFHAPLDYLPNLNDGWFLDRFRRNYYVLAVGNHDPLFDQNVKLAHELGVKQIPHILDVWEGFGHDWPWWQRMAAKFFG